MARLHTIAALGAVMLAGCNRSAPEPPLPPAPPVDAATTGSDDTVSAPASTETLPSPVTEPVPPTITDTEPAASEVSPPVVITMAPIPNPEDLPPDERRRIYGEDISRKAAREASAAPAGPARAAQKSVPGPRRHHPAPKVGMSPAQSAPLTRPPISRPAPTEPRPAAPIPEYTRLAAFFGILATALLVLAAALRVRRPVARPRRPPI